MALDIKKRLKKSIFFPFFIKSRNILRVLYSTKSRNRFLWNIRSGDEHLSLDYPLNINSTAMVVGAFEGNYLEKLDKKFSCKIFAFEPVEKYFKILEKKFLNSNNITLLNLGLSNKTETVNIFVDKESSSVFKETNSSLSADMISVSNFFRIYQISSIDLIYMNIEGGEYAVLDKLIRTGLISKIKYLQIQFHKVDKNSKNQRNIIRKKLRYTHRLAFNFPFIWERWDKK